MIMILYTRTVLYDAEKVLRAQAITATSALQLALLARIVCMNTLLHAVLAVF